MSLTFLSIISNIATVTLSIDISFFIANMYEFLFSSVLSIFVNLSCHIFSLVSFRIFHLVLCFIHHSAMGDLGSRLTVR